MSSTKPLVTIITATTGSQTLERVYKSINEQTYPNIQHLVFVDGEDFKAKENSISNSVPPKVRRDVINLPYSVGKDRWNGHRMYGAGTLLADGDYIMFLDEDNYLEPTHVADCVDTARGVDWSFSLRRIVDKDQKFVCNDDCESLGLWPSVLNENDYFVDVNCFFLSRKVSLTILPLWYRKAREPGVMEIDRAIMQVLRQYHSNYACTKNYTVNYMAGNTERSVKPEFFLQGNNVMLQRYNGKLPWKESEMLTIEF